MFLDRLNPLETMCFDVLPSFSYLGDLFPKAKTLSSVPEVLEQFKDASSDQKRNEAQQLRGEAGGLDLTAKDLRQKSIHWTEMVSKYGAPLGRIMRSPQHPLIGDALADLRRAVDGASYTYPALFKKVDDSRDYCESEWDFADRLADEMSTLAKERQDAARHLDGRARKDEIIVSIKQVLHLS
jgi:hypothetical protein